MKKELATKTSKNIINNQRKRIICTNSPLLFGYDSILPHHDYQNPRSTYNTTPHRVSTSTQPPPSLNYPWQGYYQPQNAASPQSGEHISEVPAVSFSAIPHLWISQLINQLTNQFPDQFKSFNNQVAANTAKIDFIMNNLHSHRHRWKMAAINLNSIYYCKL